MESKDETVSGRAPELRSVVTIAPHSRPVPTTWRDATRTGLGTIP
jgi:hypothetical protein